MSPSNPDNRKNAYWCPQCEGYIVTIDLQEGVTPMFLACRVKGEPSDPGNDCRGQMRSMMYPDLPWPAEDGYGNPIPTEPTYQWYRPDLSERNRILRANDGSTWEHLRKGGLLLRKIDS